jgi:carbonic anhydrase
MVLGHSKCGAVAATAAGAKLQGHLPHIAVAIQPAVDIAKQMPGNLVDNSIRENAKLVTRQLSASTPLLAPLVNAGKLKVVAAHYDIATGQVSVLPADSGSRGVL